MSETKDIRTADGRWGLLTEIAEGVFVSTVASPEDNPLFDFLNTFCKITGYVDHNEPFETLSKVNGEWGTPIGSPTKEKAREVHEQEVQRLIKQIGVYDA